MREYCPRLHQDLSVRGPDEVARLVELGGVFPHDQRIACQLLALQTLSLALAVSSVGRTTVRTTAEKYFSSRSLGSPEDDAEALSHKTILVQTSVTLTLVDARYAIKKYLKQGIAI